MAYEWSELSYLEKMSGNTGLYVLLFSVMFVFLVLAALYESWAMPLAVILVMPMCVLCSIAGVATAKLDINIFTQIGFVVLIGLASKNAILIVEFAKARVLAGEDIRVATLHACELRLRPILMTSFAFILGVLPLLAASGAGAEMRRALGTAVFSGMLGVTLFGIFLTPVFFYVIEKSAKWKIFSTGWIKQLGAISLRVIRMDPVWRAIGHAFKVVAAATRRQPRPPGPPSPSSPAPSRRTADIHVSRAETSQQVSAESKQSPSGAHSILPPQSPQSPQ